MGIAGGFYTGGGGAIVSNFAGTMDMVHKRAIVSTFVGPFPNVNELFNSRPDMHNHLFMNTRQYLTVAGVPVATLEHVSFEGPSEMIYNPVLLTQQNYSFMHKADHVTDFNAAANKTLADLFGLSLPQLHR